MHFRMVGQKLAPHSGQSSQLVLEAHGRNAQFLPTVARSALICDSLEIDSIGG